MKNPFRTVRRWLEWHSVYSHIAAPIWVRIPERHRWTVVHWLDKSSRQCWSDLVSDALCHQEDDACDISVPRLRGERAPRCATTCDWGGGLVRGDHIGEHECSCYCGKFKFTATKGYDDRREVTR